MLVTRSRFPLFLLMIAALPLPAQQPAAQANPPQEIQIDQECRIVTIDLRNPAHPKPHRRSDPAICRLESENESQHWEKVAKNGALKDVPVLVKEHEFVLQNPYAQPVVFIVHQPISKGFHIDSEPQPIDITNAVATFRVTVPPGQNSRLHVGERD